MATTGRGGRSAQLIPSLHLWWNCKGIKVGPSRHFVLGNVKGAVAVVISILMFKNPISATGVMGYLLTIIGVVLYSTAKKRSK
ncbi:hypothetical protein CsSME_00038704 [Camellia sinensis var. sinensis]